MLGAYDHVIHGMQQESTCPDISGAWGDDGMVEDYATDYSMCGANIHLISDNLPDLADAKDLEKHELYTKQASSPAHLSVSLSS